MSTIIAFLHEMWVRFTLSSPAYAKTIQKIASVVSILIGALLVMNTTLAWGWDVIIINLLLIKMALTELLGMVIMFMVGIFGAATLPVEDRKQLSRSIMEDAPSAARPVK